MNFVIHWNETAKGLHVFPIPIVFVSLINMCLGMFLFGFILYGTLCLLDFDGYFLFHVGEIFNYNLFKNFIIPFLSLFFFWDPYNLIVCAFDMVLEVSETVLSSFHSFILFSSSEAFFYHFIFQLIDSFFCFRYFTIYSF